MLRGDSRMEYTVQKLAELAGVSPRTLRFYDEIGLLKPARLSPSGYRVYGKAEVEKLQQILFYRALDVGLEEIKRIMGSPGFDEIKALQEHRRRLLAKKEQLELLLKNVEKTIEEKKGMITMSDQERFEGLKQKMVEENERKYGKEAREKYGDEAVDRSNQFFKNMSKEEFERLNSLAAEIKQVLSEAVKTGDPGGELGQKAARLHKEWLTMCWGGTYSKESHAGLAQMYVDDERFTAYYDDVQPGTAKFLRDAIFIFTGMEKSK